MVPKKGLLNWRYTAAHVNEMLMLPEFKLHFFVGIFKMELGLAWNR